MTKLFSLLAVLAVMSCWQLCLASYHFPPPWSAYVDAAFCPKTRYACCQSYYWHEGLGILWVKADGYSLANADDVDKACAALAGARWNSYTYDCTHDTPVFQHTDHRISRDCSIRTY